MKLHPCLPFLRRIGTTQFRRYSGTTPVSECRICGRLWACRSHADIVPRTVAPGTDVTFWTVEQFEAVGARPPRSAKRRWSPAR